MSDLVGNPEDRFSRVAAQIQSRDYNYEGHSGINDNDFIKLYS